jgi:hypothetical protein
MQRIENKKILLLCKENSTYVMSFLGRKLNLNNNEICFFFVNHFETYLNKSDINKFTYFKVKQDFISSSIFDLNSVVEEYLKAMANNRKPDLIYLKYLEDNYTFFKNIQCQLLSTQLFTAHLHDRFYYKIVKMQHQLLWLEMLYRYIIDFFKNNRFDIILDIDIAELPRSVIAEVANKNGVQYVSVEHSRFRNYKIPTYSTKWWNPKFYRSLDDRNKISSEAELELENYYNHILVHDLLGPEYKLQPTFKINLKGVYLKYVDFINIIIYTIKSDILARNYFIKRRSRVLFHGSLSFVYFYFLSFFRRFYLMYFSKIFDDKDLDPNYFYMPLHLIPESSTFNLAPYYTNELYIIEQVSKSLPIDSVLYVKEHPSMLGERNLNFYRRVKQFPNVSLISPKTFNDQKSLINNSKGVITITGTSAFEAALLGKGSIIFGDVPFDKIKGVYKINNFEELPIHLPILDNVDNKYSLLNYINKVIQFGEQVNISFLLQRSENNIKNNIFQDDELDAELEKLLLFFMKAID